MASTCEFCGKEGLLALAVHKRFCPVLKAKKVEEQKIKEQADAEQRIIDDKAKEEQKISDTKAKEEQKVADTKAKAEVKIPDVKTFKPDPNYDPHLIPENERLRKFVEKLPAWTGSKPGFWKRLSASRAGVPFKEIVFVGEGREPTICYIPYDAPRQRLIIPGQGFYKMPIKGEIAFLSYDHLLPLVNSPNLKNQYQLPSHVVMAEYNAGLNEGISQRFEELLAELQKWKLYGYMGMAVGFVCLVALVYMTYSSSKTIGTLTATIDAIRVGVDYHNALIANSTIVHNAISNLPYTPNPNAIVIH